MEDNKGYIVYDPNMYKSYRRSVLEREKSIFYHNLLLGLERQDNADNPEAKSECKK